MLLCASYAGAAVLLASAPSPASAQAPRPVTDARLANPEKENWLQYRGNHQGWGYSPLEQITTDNVKDLVPVWSLSTGLDEGHEAPPIVNDGVMYVSTPQNNVAGSGSMATSCISQPSMPASSP
jgi:alcohol dehydrogenase (cytochrome c)